MSADIAVASRETILPLAGAHNIMLTRGAHSDELRICTADGDHPLLTISVGPAGIAVRVTAASVTIEATELLKLEAKKLVLSALQELIIESGGPAAITIAGDLALTAAAQTITATQGEVRVLANDDVKLNGERVMMNCDE